MKKDRPAFSSHPPLAPARKQVPSSSTNRLETIKKRERRARIGSVKKQKKVLTYVLVLTQCKKDGRAVQAEYVHGPTKTAGFYLKIDRLNKTPPRNMTSSPPSPTSSKLSLLLSSTLPISSNSFSSLDIQPSLPIDKVKRRESRQNPTASHSRKSLILNCDVAVAVVVGDQPGQAGNSVRPLAGTAEKAESTNHQAEAGCQRSSDGDTSSTDSAAGTTGTAASPASQPASAFSRLASSSDPPSTLSLLSSPSPPPSAPIAIPNHRTLGQMSELTTIPLTARVPRGGYFPFATSPSPPSSRQLYSSGMTQYWPAPQPVVSSRHAAYNIYTNSGLEGQRNSQGPMIKIHGRPTSPTFASPNTSSPQSHLLQVPPRTHPQRARRNLHLTSLPSFHPANVEIASLPSQPLHRHSSDAQRRLHQQQRELIANATRTPPLYFQSTHDGRTRDPSPPRLCPLGSPGDSVTPLALEGQQGGDYLLAGALRMSTTSTHALKTQSARLSMTEELVDELIRNEMTRMRENCNNLPGSSPDGIAPPATDSSLAQGILPSDGEASFGLSPEIPQFD